MDNMKQSIFIGDKDKKVFYFLFSFFCGWEGLALLTLPLRLVCEVGGKGKCAKCAEQ